MRRPSSILLALSLAGCIIKIQEGSGAEDPPSTTAESSTPNTDAQTANFVEAEGPETPAAAETALPDCPPNADADTYCTEAGKLAGQWLPVDRVRVPADAQLLFSAEHPELDDQPSLQIAIVGASLTIRVVSCGACRRVMGAGFSGELDQLSEAQLRALQTKLGLRPDAPLLDSAEAWQRFVADAQGQASLTELSARGR